MQSFPFLQDCFKGAANCTSIFPSVLSCYRRIHQNWKTHLHYGSCAAHRGFTLNPVRKRSARSSISRVRAGQEDMQRDAAEMLWISSALAESFSPSFSLSLSETATRKTACSTYFLEFCSSLSFFSIVIQSVLYSPRYISLRCIFPWLCSCTNETRWIVIKYTLH